jgi:cell wall-associated NlpC family hydrolase
MPQIKAIPVAAIAVGSLFVYTGIKGYSILKAVQNVIKGSGPQSGQTVTLLAQPGHEGDTAGGGFSGNVSSNAVAAKAESYVGKLRYVYGGPPPAGTVDCSSFASKVLHECGIKNPGGSAFNPDVHGPNTISYLSWSGAHTVGHNASDAQAGDLCVWQTHMGIAIGGGKMVSARSQSASPNVGVDNIAGDIPGEFLFVRRLV